MVRRAAEADVLPDCFASLVMTGVLSTRYLLMFYDEKR
jgi:hypothetical protein